MIFLEKCVIENKLVKKFNSFVEFEQFVLKINDMELLGKIKIVKIYYYNFFVFIYKILVRIVKDFNIVGKGFEQIEWGKLLVC